MSTASSPHVVELGVGETHRAHAAMVELRPTTAADLGAFVERVEDVQRAQGYRLFASFEPDEVDEGSAAAVAGFRTVSNLAWGDVLYLDDLSTRPEHRGRGHARALLAALAEEGRQLGCRAIHLDSGHQRHAAHRLYLAAGYRIVSHHFGRDLGDPSDRPG